MESMAASTRGSEGSRQPSRTDRHEGLAGGRDGLAALLDAPGALEPREAAGEDLPVEMLDLALQSRGQRLALRRLRLDEEHRAPPAVGHVDAVGRPRRHQRRGARLPRAATAELHAQPGRRADASWIA